MLGLDWVTIEQVLNVARRVILHGPPGTGKTRTPEVLAEARGQNVYSVTVHDDMSAQELVGHFVPAEGGMFAWHDGPAIRAWREGGLLILNEVDRASGSVLTALYSLLDDPESAVLTLTSGETVRPSGEFRAVMTLNGDPTVLPEALLSRAEAVLYVGKPHPMAMEALPQGARDQVMNAYESEDRRLDTRKVRSFLFLVGAGIMNDEAATAVWGDAGKDVAAALALGARPEGKKGGKK